MAKIALISGASRGIGRAIALKLANDAWDLILISRSEEDLQALKTETAKLGVQVRTLKCDISRDEEVESALKQVLSTTPRIVLVVLNAGVGKFGPVVESDASDWDAMMITNAKGSFMVSKIVAPSMIEAGSGQMIFIASDVSRRTFPGGAIYCASKFAQYAFANGLKQELRTAGVRVSIILPGMVATHFNDGKSDAPEKKDWLRPSDIADAVAYIANAPRHLLIDEIMLHPMCQEV